MSSARSTSPSQTKHTIRPLNSTSGATQPSRVPVKAAGQLFDTPRGFEEETVTDDHALAVELDSVKRERQSLLESIAHVKAEAGAGCNVQSVPYPLRRSAHHVLQVEGTYSMRCICLYSSLRLVHDQLLGTSTNTVTVGKKYKHCNCSNL